MQKTRNYKKYDVKAGAIRLRGLKIFISLLE